MNPRRFSHTNRILIRSANWVGDAIMTTPAIAAIRHNFPHAKITLLAKPWVVPVFDHNPHVDEVMVYDDNGRHHGPLGKCRLSRDLKKRRFDLAILFQNAFEAALLAWMAKIPRRLGYTTDVRSLLLTDRIRNWRELKKGHLIDYYTGLLTGAGLVVNGRQMRLYLSMPERDNARQRLAALGVVKTGPLIGINPGATYGTAKRWPDERYVKLSRHLIKNQHAQVLIFGGPGEAGLGEKIAAQVGKGCLNLCNRTNLREAMALIQCCHVFITNDSGLMHVASALNIPQLAIIGPTDPVATGPAGPTSQMIQVAGSCELAPCLKSDCPLDHRCMTAISVESVLEVIVEILDKQGNA